MAPPSEHFNYRSLPTVLCVVCAVSCGCRMRLISDAVRTPKVIGLCLDLPSQIRRPAPAPEGTARLRQRHRPARKRAEPITPRNARRLPFLDPLRSSFHWRLLSARVLSSRTRPVYRPPGAPSSNATPPYPDGGRSPRNLRRGWARRYLQRRLRVIPCARRQPGVTRLSACHGERSRGLHRRFVRQPPVEAAVRERLVARRRPPYGRPYGSWGHWQEDVRRGVHDPRPGGASR